MIRSISISWQRTRPRHRHLLCGGGTQKVPRCQRRPTALYSSITWLAMYSSIFLFFIPTVKRVEEVEISVKEGNKWPGPTSAAILSATAWSGSQDREVLTKCRTAVLELNPIAPRLSCSFWAFFDGTLSLQGNHDSRIAASCQAASHIALPCLLPVPTLHFAPAFATPSHVCAALPLARKIVS